MSQQAARNATPQRGPDAVPGQVRAAVAVIWLEVLALAGTCVLLVVKTLTGHPNSVGRAMSVVGLVVVAALVLALAARGLMHLRPAARTPVLVLEFLALPTSFSLAFQAHRIGYGGPIMIAALVVLYLLFTPPAREALDRED